MPAILQRHPLTDLSSPTITSKPKNNSKTPSCDASSESSITEMTNPSNKSSSWTTKVNHDDQPSKLNEEGSNDRSFKHRIKTIFACNSASIDK